MLDITHLNLMPQIPEQSTNPHLATMFNGVKIGNTTFLGTFTDGQEMILSAYAYLHPNSPFKGNTDVFNRLFFLIDTGLTNWHNNIKLNDMGYGMEACIAYLLLLVYEPQSIPADRPAIWDDGIDKNNAAILAEKPNVYENHIVGDLWLNGDLREAIAVYFGSIIVDDAVSYNKVKTTIEGCMLNTLLADGGTHYAGYNTESPSYHGEATMRTWVWYYLLTGLQSVKDYIIATNPYIPMVVVPNGDGYKEWTTSPSWKPYYNRTTLKQEALMKAYISGEPYNYGIGITYGAAHILHGFLYRSDVTVSKSLPTDYFYFDRNSLGVRGLTNNKYGVVSVMRDPSSPLPELNETPFQFQDGMASFVGSFTLNADTPITQHALNAAFHGTAPEIAVKSTPETDWNRGQRWAFLTGKDCKNNDIKSLEVYGFTTKYNVTRQRFVATKWDAYQQWVITKDRVIGMCEIEATTANSTYGLAQRIALVSGRKNACGTRKDIVIIDDNNFEYGDLKVRIHAKNYAGIVDTHTFSIMNIAGDDFSTMIALHDVNSGRDKSTTYYFPKNTKRYALVEVINNERVFSNNVTALSGLATGLDGFEFEEPTLRKITIVHNHTATALDYNGSFTTPYNRFRTLKSWTETLDVIEVVGGIVLPTISIPAFSSVMFINSNIDNDFILGNLYKENIFV